MCQSCSNQSLSDAVDCSAGIMRRTTPATIDRSADVPRFRAPPALNASSYADRMALDPVFLGGEVLIETLASFPETTKMEMGYSFESMIVDCKYSGQKCDSEYVIRQIIIIITYKKLNTIHRKKYSYKFIEFFLISIDLITSLRCKQMHQMHRDIVLLV